MIKNHSQISFFIELIVHQKLNNLPPNRAARSCFMNTTRNKDIIPIRTKSLIGKSCSCPMCRWSLQTAIPYETPLKRRKSYKADTVNWRAGSMQKSGGRDGQTWQTVIWKPMTAQNGLPCIPILSRGLIRFLPTT